MPKTAVKYCAMAHVERWYGHLNQMIQANYRIWSLLASNLLLVPSADFLFAISALNFVKINPPKFCGFMQKDFDHLGAKNWTYNIKKQISSQHLFKVYCVNPIRTTCFVKRATASLLCNTFTKGKYFFKNFNVHKSTTLLNIRPSYYRS